MSLLGKSMRLTRPLVIFDLETTGLQVLQDRIIEFAAIKFYPNGNRETWATLVNPGREIADIITAITGITAKELRQAPPLDEVYPQISEMVMDADLCGHNIWQFDAPLLLAEFARIGRVLPGPRDRAYLDTKALVDTLDPARSFGHSLRASHAALCGEHPKVSHRASDDVIAAWGVLEVALCRLDWLDRSPAEIEKLTWGATAEERRLQFLAGQAAKNSVGQASL